MSKRKRILYLSNSAALGGMEIHLLNLVEGMVKKGYEIFVICPWGEMVERYFDAGANVRVDYPRIDLDPFYIFRLIKFIRQNRIEVLHAHQLKTVINGLIAGKVANVPLKIAHIHTPLSQWQISPLKKRIDIFVNRIVTNLCADKAIALTEATKKERVEGEGIAPEKIVVIPNGIKLKAQSSKRKAIAQTSKLTVGTLGRLTIEKGTRVFVEAIPHVITSSPHHLNFIIAGDGELRGELETQVKKLGIGDSITFLGFVPEEKKLDVLSSFDIFVFPSLAEGFGIALIEAMALGLPCVVSDLPVLREVTDGGRCAILFETANAQDLAEKIIQLSEDTNLRQQLGQKARRRVEENYSLERFIENYDHLYQQ